MVFVAGVVGFKEWLKPELQTPTVEQPKEENEEEIEEEQPETEQKETISLNERLAGVAGEYYLRVKGDATLTIATKGDTALGAQSVKKITIEGVNGATLKATGEGAGKIKASGQGVLVLRNFTIIDETPHKGTYYHEYLAFGGNVIFENCEFKQSIKVIGDSATFTDCSFDSPWHKYYSVWVGNGTTSFKNCTFTGYRALKIHEYEEYEQDILSVEIDGCTFNEILEKPGIAIGKFPVNPEQTAVRVTNCTFTDCQPWDREGSIEGIDGFYEADIYTRDFAFYDENNTVNGQAVSAVFKRIELEENQLPIVEFPAFKNSQ